MPDSREKSTEDLLKANIKRSSIKGQITKFKNYLDKLPKQPSNIELTELKLKLKKFEAISLKFDDLQTEIEVLNSNSLDFELEQREVFEGDIISVIATVKNYLEIHDNDKRSCDIHGVGIKLPQIEIAKFDGAFFRWQEFRDTFEGMVHLNKAISPIQKFYYLNSYLEGDAARVISNLEICSENYEIAWKLLNDRFNNKRLLIDQHLNSLCNIQPLSRESERSLRFLVDHVNKNLRALSSLGLPTDEWDVLLIFTLSKKLDQRTLLKWEELRNSSPDEIPSLTLFNNFLTDRANVLAAMNRQHANNKPSTSSPNILSQSFKSNVTKPFPKGQLGLVSVEESIVPIKNCLICKDNHKIHECPMFKSMDITNKLSQVAIYKLCAICLRPGHPTKKCRMAPCRICKQKHNMLLHKDIQTESTTATTDIEHVTALCNQTSSKQVLLSTAIIIVTNPVNHKSEKVRALLDSGSQSTFISKSLKEKLLLKSNRINTIDIIGIGNSSANQVKESCIAQLGSLHGPYHVTLSCLVLEKLTGDMPSIPIDLSQLCLPADIQLADPSFDQPIPVEVLIGADLFWDILRPNQRNLGPNKPKLHSTQFGWILAGSINLNFINLNKPSIQCINASIHTSSLENEIHAFLPKFWELEEVPKKTILSENDKLCEQHFLQNTVRLSSGRFIVRLPLKKSPYILGDSFHAAKTRFLSLEKRFRKNPNLKIQYTQFIHEYEALGHLSVSPVVIPDFNYFLCHHAVFNDDSESTKLRVVFDGSNPTSSGYSLNDILMVGPNIQDSIFSILIRARQYKYLLCGDIEKMYRQVMVDERDRKLQLILWREEESQPIKTLKLNTLTYGTASASYLSTRCLWQIGEECEDQTIRTIIQKDFFVDDLVTGANEEESLLSIKNSVTTALESAGMNLRKFKSNCCSVFQNSPIEEQQNLIFSDSTNTLGLGWDYSKDNLFFPSKPILNKPITKRFILSQSFKIYDPLGLLSPCVIIPKLIFQSICNEEIGWDQPLSQPISREWQQFYENIHCLTSLRVPRRAMCNKPVLVQLHSFSDASERAYGAAIYMRSIDKHGFVTVRLLCAKSKVAQRKPLITIPRLELCGALLAAQLCRAVTDAIRYKPNSITHWCDSSIVLCWLNADSAKLKTFVANRVGTILELTTLSNWRHVPTDSNPADFISRGVNPSQLEDLDLWWLGPKFLLKNESEWPVLTQFENFTDLPEIKNLQTNSKTKQTKSKIKQNLKNNKKINILTSLLQPKLILDFNHYSSLNKLQRTIAHVKRFIYNLKNKNQLRVGPLTSDELNESFIYLCSVAQQQAFTDEFNLLSEQKPLRANSRILSLSPFLDKHVIRVGGRIEASDYEYEKKHPILLDAGHYLTKLIFEQQHIRNLHAGPQLLLAIVREYVWPINGRRLSRLTVRRCVRCTRVKGRTIIPKMGNLPVQRVTADYPFISVGVDIGGPFNILNRKGRGARLIKCYLCLFICLRYKCIHLEAVSDLSKEAFMMTLRRFISRRGRPAEIFSDNGRNFLAASKDISNFFKLHHETFSDWASKEGIKFNFIPPYASHFAGVWEAGIKSAKYHIKRVMGNAHLTFEEICTLFAQVEAVLNSRPLCPISNSPDDFLPLSPGHFLVGRPLTALPAPSLENRFENSLTRYNRLQKMFQHFWSRWQREYIAELQERKKWKRSDGQHLTIGDLVIIHEDHTPPLCWRLGRIAKLFPGSDGISRVADVNTTRGCIRRPVVKLCPLHPIVTEA
ncbi:hypothetical protein K1T71_012767 [Dendrolimus kikuchii]|uniref:Uncharacterized protein n=1 Tax=Dendrolimus kikuchii TaxID=765133 RepID=A0ACC1CK90_9NEOP|nr:hypothetical protein K1T71_012767 [Dendrolimus kikuchii]